MDPLTHTATGLFLARAGLKRWTPLATPILLIAANAPDFDAISGAGGSLEYLRYHRHLTHSVAALPLMALISVLIVRLASRRPVRWAGALGVAAIAVASHLLLDLTNVYGIRLWLPFSGEWLRLDLTSVVDFWIWAVIAVALAGPFLGKLVGSEIASARVRAPHHGRGFAILALVFLVAYNAGRASLHARALATLDSRLYQNAQPERVAAFPDPLNPLRWRGLVETGEFVALAEVNLAGDFDPGRAAVFHKPEADPAFRAARATPAFETFLDFAQFPFWEVSPEGEGRKRVTALDLRFGNPAEPGFAATAVVDAGMKVVRSAFEWGPIKPR